MRPSDSSGIYSQTKYSDTVPKIRMNFFNERTCFIMNYKQNIYLFIEWRMVLLNNNLFSYFLYIETKRQGNRWWPKKTKNYSFDLPIQLITKTKMLSCQALKDHSIKFLCHN